MLRSKILFVAAMLIITTAEQSNVRADSLYLLPATSEPVLANKTGVFLVGVNPKNTPAFGQTIQITVQALKNGKPVANTNIEWWFSGQHGIQTYHAWGKTDRSGNFTFTATVPRDFYYVRSWVDLNVACNAIPDLKLYRIRNKP